MNSVSDTGAPTALRLYERDDCPFCWKVRLALAALKLPYESIQVELGEKHPDVIALSPEGRSSVPVLVDGDQAIWESTVILEYLADRYDTANQLLPKEPELRAKARLLVTFSDQIIGPGLRRVIFEKRSKPQDEWDMSEIEQGMQMWQSRMAELETWLAGEAFFVGGRFSVVECALLPRFALAYLYGAGVSQNTPALYRWFQHLKNSSDFLSVAPATVPQYGGYHIPQWGQQRQSHRLTQSDC